MQTITVSSFKGGTAKTSTVIHLGSALSKFHKKKVLLSALQTAKLFTLFNHYKDIHRHIK